MRVSHSAGLARSQYSVLREKERKKRSDSACSRRGLCITAGDLSTFEEDARPFFEGETLRFLKPSRDGARDPVCLVVFRERPPRSSKLRLGKGPFT